MKKYLIKPVNSMGEPLSLNLKDLAKSSLMLREEVKTLQHFVENSVNIITEETFQIMLREIPLITKRFLICWEDKFILITDLNGWELLNTAYAMYKTPNAAKEQVHNDTIAFNENYKLEIAAATIVMNQLKEKHRNLIKQAIWKRSINYFDADKFMTAFRQRINSSDQKAKYSYNKETGEITLEFENIKIGNEAEGYVVYHKILLFLTGWNISAYILRFNNFDYNSCWGVPVTLHPALSIDTFTTERIDEILDDYNSYVNAIFENIYKYDPSNSFQTIEKIQERLFILRKLWNQLRYKETKRIELSKMIFNNYLRNKS